MEQCGFRKWRGQDSPLEPLQRPGLCWPLDFRILNSRTERAQILLFQATQSGVFCYSSPRRPYTSIYSFVQFADRPGNGETLFHAVRSVSEGRVMRRPHPRWGLWTDSTPPMTMFLCWAVWQGRAEQAGVGGSVSSLRLVYEAKRAECLPHRIQRAERAQARCMVSLLMSPLQQAHRASEAAASGISSFWVKLAGQRVTEKASCCLPSYCFNPLCDPPVLKQCSTWISQLGREVVSKFSKQLLLPKRNQFSVTS